MNQGAMAEELGSSGTSLATLKSPALAANWNAKSKARTAQAP